ncbi:lysyl oxidase homolog 1-like, partial [Marmota monax]|uniref:lysyl oxidase homolog 1-like n=1 Tax=Marmota monax TaxID=9995 RepID=UPI001EAFB835
IPLAKPERPFHQLLGSGSPGAPSAPGAKARGEEPATGGGQAEFAYLPRSPKQVLSRRAQGARDEGGEPGAPFRPQGAVRLRQRGDGAALSGPTWPQPGRLGRRDRRGGGSALQGGQGGDRRAGAVPVVAVPVACSLRRLVPTIPPNKKVSKVEILQHVIDYILDLQLALETHPALLRQPPALLRQPPPPAPPHHPAGSCPAAPLRTPLTALNTHPVCSRLSPSQEL